MNPRMRRGQLGGAARFMAVGHPFSLAGYDRSGDERQGRGDLPATPPRPARPHLSSANTRGQMVRHSAR